MSGVGEAALVIGLISSCISIVDTSKKLLDAAKDAKGLPEALRTVHAQLPLIESTLKNIKSRSTSASDEQCAPVAQAAQACRVNAEKLDKVLQDVIPGEKDGVATRYFKHIKAVGKGGKVERLTQDILKQLQHLQANHVFANVATTKDLEEAIAQLDNVDEAESPHSYISHGSGSINVAHVGSSQTNHNYSGNFNTTGPMYFGSGTN